MTTALGSLDVDTFLLEYDDERSGGFEPLRSVPPGKNVVLGLITSKTPVLESVDAVRRRIDEASRYVPLQHLALSTQCGFASIASGNLLSLEDQWRKLELVVETARDGMGLTPRPAEPHHARHRPKRRTRERNAAP